ncbi:hypothetical protein Daus18300_001200 [Diaporthe australafricana]|uniref:Uncharacterized protein n=1 Tax=Diaporthe australafricana TaxID=127596 RepID=A0ABR3Y0C5_9PEZI
MPLKGDVGSNPPSTLRRTARRPAAAAREREALEATGPALQFPRGAPRPGSHDYSIRTLLKLPGFHFTSTKAVFQFRDSAQLATILGARVELADHKKAMPAGNQKDVCVRIADVIEACCDEWLDDWQEKALTDEFWVDAAERLRCSNKFWANTVPTPVQVHMICMSYTTRWDENGRGDAPEADWGFELGELTWGKVKAQIDPDFFAKPWNYERASARDFSEYVKDSETNFGPIQDAAGLSIADKNTSTNRRGGRPLARPGEASDGSKPAADPIIVSGPHRTIEKGKDNGPNAMKVTIDRSDPKRLMVTFSRSVCKENGGTQETQEVHKGDEGKHIRSVHEQ